MEPAARGRGRRHPRLRAVRGGAAPGGADAGRGAHDLLPQVAPRRRADPALHAAAARGRGPRRHRRADRPLPRGLHADAAARDRAAARRGRPARGRRHRRARARHRRRRPGRRHLRDLPGHGGEPAPDVGPGGPPRDRPRAVRGRRRRARPVLLPAPGRVPRPAGRAGDPRPRVGGDPHAAPGRGRLRAPAHRRRRRRARPALGAVRGAARRARPPARAGRALHAAHGRVPGRPDLAALRGHRVDRGRRGGRRRADRLGRDRPRPLDPPPGRRLPPHGPELRGRGARPARAAARSSARSPATGTRSRRRRPRPTSRRSSTGARSTASSCRSASCR